MAILVRENKRLLSTSARCPLGQVNLAAYLRNSPGLPPNPLRVFGSYALVLILHGGGRYVDAMGTDRHVQTGDCILVLPDLPHTYYRRPQDPRWDELFITFSGPAFDLWRKTGLISTDRLIHPASPLDYWHQRLLRCVNPDPLQAVTYVQRFLAELLGAGRTRTDDDAEWLTRATRLIGIGPKPDWHAIAKEMDCGYESFRRRFATLTGEPPARFHAERVIEHASELLADPHRSLRDIAIDCGFCDEFHFSRRFKQLMGVRPAALRDRLLGASPSGGNDE